MDTIITQTQVTGRFTAAQVLITDVKNLCIWMKRVPDETEGIDARQHSTSVISDDSILCFKQNRFRRFDPFRCGLNIIYIY